MEVGAEAVDCNPLSIFIERCVALGAVLGFDVNAVGLEVGDEVGAGVVGALVESVGDGVIGFDVGGLDGDVGLVVGESASVGL